MKTRFALGKLTAFAVAVLGSALLAFPAQAQLVSYTQGDLLLGFHKAGVSNDVVINIGQASLYRDATADFSVNVGNLGTLLGNTFGAGWANDDSLQWAVVGNPNGVGADTGNTSYLTSPQLTLDTQSDPLGASSTNRGFLSTRFQTMKNQFILQNSAAGNANAVIWNSNANTGSYVDWTESMSDGAPSGLVLGVFDPALIVGQSGDGIDYPGSALDLYRLLTAQSGTSGVSYEGTFRIDSTGAVTFGITPGVGAVPEPSRALLLAFGLALPLMRRRRSSITGVPALA
jgi:hypothetical protein